MALFFKRTLCTLTLSCFAYGCGLGDQQKLADHSSNLSQLTRDDHPCHTWSSERISSAYKNFPPSMMKRWTGVVLERANQAIAGIPDEYLRELGDFHGKNGFYIEAKSPGFYGGLTMASESQPYYILVYPEDRAVDLTMQHEVGHALEPIIRRFTRDRQEISFDEELSPIAEVEYDNPNLNDYPRSYSQNSSTYRKEFFAEAFNSYYCSPDTHAMIREQFPSTFAFLERILAPVLW